MGVSTAPDETVPVDERLPADVQTAFEELPTGVAASGEQLFKVTQPCHTCHMDVPVGPPFPGEQPFIS
jgi:mono/diheme cytochrome c family protein